MVYHNKNFGTKLCNELNICNHFSLFICVLPLLVCHLSLTLLHLFGFFCSSVL